MKVYIVSGTSYKPLDSSYTASSPYSDGTGSAYVKFLNSGIVELHLKNYRPQNSCYGITNGTDMYGIYYGGELHVYLDGNCEIKLSTGSNTNSYKNIYGIYAGGNLIIRPEPSGTYNYSRLTVKTSDWTASDKGCGHRRLRRENEFHRLL